MNIPILQVALNNDQDLITARQRTKDIAEKAGLGHQDQTRLITAVSEIARNALMYARGGKLRLAIKQVDSRQYVQAVISDTGAGIANLDAILSEKYQSRTGLGKGIAGSKRIVDLFEIDSSINGTSISLGKVIAANRAISAKDVTAWLKALEKLELPSPLIQLQEQNQQLVQTLEELQKTQTELEEASRHKGEFLANISHEIRTPLNALLGLNKILSKTELDGEQLRLVKLSREAGLTLLALINDVLDLSKIESGMMTIHSVEFDLHLMIRNTIELFSIQGDEKGLKLTLTIDPKVPPYVVGDDLRIRQILVNLVGNAVKFSEIGGVETDVQLLEREGENFRVRLSVKDSGPGISVAQKKKLFQAFTQGDGSVTRKHGGTGLGLSISRHLVELMHGQIGVESELHKGSTFWFELPLLIAADRVANQSDEVLPTSDLEFVEQLANNLILVAEDHPVNQLVAASELEEMGFEVHLAGNGEEAFEKAQATRYQLVFMDCQMPVMDGFSATRQLRAAKNDVPIVAMTANALDGDRERCLESGMNDYISKPFETEDLRRVVTRWIKSAAEPKEPAIDYAALEKRFQPKQVAKLMDAFQADLPKSVSSIISAIDTNNHAEAQAVAHSFRSACAMVFAKPLAQVLSQIEMSCKQNQLDALPALSAQLKQLSDEMVVACERYRTTPTT